MGYSPTVVVKMDSIFNKVIVRRGEFLVFFALQCARVHFKCSIRSQARRTWGKRPYNRCFEVSKQRVIVRLKIAQMSHFHAVDSPVGRLAPGPLP